MNEELSMPSMDLMTVKRLPPSLRGTIFETILAAISEELSLWRGIMGKIKTSLYDIDKMDEARLRAIAKTLGTSLPSVILGGVELIREEVRSIPFKVTHKGTVILYKSLFLTVGRIGEIFIYTFNDGDGDIRPSLRTPWGEVEMAGIGVPFPRVSLGDFSGTIVGCRTLDAGEALDGGGDSGYWRLDTGITEISTNHLGLEYVIDRKIERDGKEYLMTREYLEYIGDNMEWGRRAKEVPHIGSQLSFAINGDGTVCNIPSIGLVAVASADFFDKIHKRGDVGAVEFGCGVQDVSGGIPSSLANRICVVKNDYVAIKDKETGGVKTVAMSGTYDGQRITDVTVLEAEAFDGTAQHFSFTLPHSPIRKGSVCLSLIDSDGEKREVKDNGNGAFVSSWCMGSVDYMTGKCSLSTTFERSIADNIIDVSSAIEGRNKFTGVLSGRQATVGSALLYFSMDGRVYTVRDSGKGDGTGEFASEFIHCSSLNYATGEFEIIFIKDVAKEAEYAFRCRYTRPISFVPKAGSILEASYLFTESTVLITEAAFKSAEGDMIAYASFPPFEFTSNAYHLSLMIAVQNSTD